MWHSSTTKFRQIGLRSRMPHWSPWPVGLRTSLQEWHSSSSGWRRTVSPRTGCLVYSILRGSWLAYYRRIRESTRRRSTNWHSSSRCSIPTWREFGRRRKMAFTCMVCTWKERDGIISMRPWLSNRLDRSITRFRLCYSCLWRSMKPQMTTTGIYNY